jgi:pyruvate,water dikinase
MLRIYLRISDEANPLKLRAERLRQRRHLLAGCQRRLRNPLKRWLFNFMIKQAQHGLAQRENVKNEGVRAIACIRRALLEAGERLTRRGILRERDDVFFLDLKELRQVLTGPVAFDATGIIAARKVEYARNQEIVPPPVVVGHFDSESFIPEAADAKATLLKGLAISPGIVTGKARVILRADTDERVLPGEILVAPFTDPGWSPYFIPAAGLVADIGGQLSHGSIVAREHGIPAVVNVGPATKIIQTGQLIRVDGHRGLVTILADD